MIKKTTRRGLLGACALGLAAISSGCTGVMPFGRQREEFDREIDVNTGRITVETDSGDAAVNRTEADRVQLHGIKETTSMFTDLEDINVEATRNGDHLRISGDSGGDSFLSLGGGTISFDVGVPEGIAVERISAENGDATATGIAGDTTLESTNGAATAISVDGSVSLASTNGPVRTRNVWGLERAATTNGYIDVDIPAINDGVSVSTTNGTVTAALALDLNTTVVASTTNGDITANGLPLNTRGSGKSFRGTLGDGTHKLTIETTNGDITLYRLR